MPPTFSFEKVAQLIKVVCKEEINKDFFVSLFFTDKEHMYTLNNNFRGKDYATNVLSFPFDYSLEDKEYLGEIFLCHEVIQKENDSEDYLLFLILHSLLHLLGYDHDSDETWKEMEEREKYYCAKLNIKAIC